MHLIKFQPSDRHEVAKGFEDIGKPIEFRVVIRRLIGGNLNHTSDDREVESEDEEGAPDSRFQNTQRRPQAVQREKSRSRKNNEIRQRSDSENRCELEKEKPFPGVRGEEIWPTHQQYQTSKPEEAEAARFESSFEVPRLQCDESKGDNTLGILATTPKKQPEAAG